MLFWPDINCIKTTSCIVVHFHVRFTTQLGVQLGRKEESEGDIAKEIRKCVVWWLFSRVQRIIFLEKREIEIPWNPEEKNGKRKIVNVVSLPYWQNLYLAQTARFIVLTNSNQLCVCMDRVLILIYEFFDKQVTSCVIVFQKGLLLFFCYLLKRTSACDSFSFLPRAVDVVMKLRGDLHELAFSSKISKKKRERDIVWDERIYCYHHCCKIKDLFMRILN